jgi:hypothetical protein
MCTLFYAITRRFFRLFDASVHTDRARVATIIRLRALGESNSDERENMSTRHFSAERKPGNRERFIKFGKARALEGAGAVTVGIDPGYIKKDDSIALSWHWKQTFGSRFPLVVSSDLLSRRQCGRTKSQELNGATSTPAAACSSFEIGRILERRRATTSEFPCWMYQVVVRKPAWDDHGVVASGARFSRTDIADRIFARRWILLPTHASRLPKLSRLRSRIWRAPENPSIPWTWN